MADIDDTGYVLKSTVDWFTEEQARYLAIDAEWNLDPSSPDGLKLAWDSEIFGALDQVLMQAYNSKDPNKAAGVDLYAICAFTGVTPNAGAPSTVVLTIYGEDGPLSLAGKTVTTLSRSSFWAIDEDVTVSGGIATVNATCTEIGSISEDIGAISVIVDTVSGWTGVSNPVTPSVGSPVEKDSVLRSRRRASTSRTARGFTDAMRAGILDVSGVSECKIYNNTSASVKYGIPGRTFMVTVLPSAGWTTALEYAVAEVIYLNLPPGAAMHSSSSTAVEVFSPVFPSNSETIYFRKASAIYFEITVTLLEASGLNDTAISDIKESIEGFFDGSVFSGLDGFTQSAPGIGDSIHWNQVLAAIQYALGRYSSVAYVSSLAFTDDPSVDISNKTTLIGSTSAGRVSASGVTVVV